MQRPPLTVAGVARGDVIRLSRGDPGAAFFGIEERSSWDTQRLAVANAVTANPDAYNEFRAAIGALGGIVEGNCLTSNGFRVIVSLPPGTPREQWWKAYDRLVERTARRSADDLLAEIAESARQRAAAALDDQRRIDRVQRRREALLSHAVGAVAVLGALAAVALTTAWVWALLSSRGLTRPQLAALGMLVALVPLVVAEVVSRSAGPGITGSVASLGAMLLATMITRPGYAIAALVLGVVYAVSAAVVGFLYLASSFLTESSQRRRMTLLFGALPCILSAAAAIVYVVTVARASSLTFGLTTIGRIAGILIAIPVVSLFRPRSRGAVLGCARQIGVIALVVWLVRHFLLH